MQKILTVVVLTLAVLLTSINPSVLAGTINSDNGGKIFQVNCAGCHARGGNIVRRRKNLKLKTLHKRKLDTEEAIASLVSNGKGIMSAYGDKLTAEEIKSVSAYVLQRASENWK